MKKEKKEWFFTTFKKVIPKLSWIFYTRMTSKSGLTALIPLREMIFINIIELKIGLGKENFQMFIQLK